jgi:hypothetical protein
MGSFFQEVSRSGKEAQVRFFYLLFMCSTCLAQPGQWTELRKDLTGARPGSALRYSSQAKAFFLWGFMNADPGLLQESPLMVSPEYDVVVFDPEDSRWRNHLPAHMESEWSKRLPLAYVPRTYSGITTGSERTVMRGRTEEEEAVPRPDLNIVFDQVTYNSAANSLIYFTGGLTASYDIARQRWSDLAPASAPPPVLGGSLAYDLLRDEIILFGGGHVAERTPDGKIAGNTGTWVYRTKYNDWRELSLKSQPPPRMNSRMVCDTRNDQLVLFGGDGQSHYLADTWIFDLKTRRWRQSSAPGGPEPRAGHFTVYDPDTGWTIIGGGYNRVDLADMWAYDPAGDSWKKLKGEVPTGFYLSADIAPEKRLIVLVTSTRTPGDQTACNILYPVRTTYGYRIDKEIVVHSDAGIQPHEPMPKRQKGGEAAALPGPKGPDSSIPINQWVLLNQDGQAAPTRTWGSATFDTRRGEILYWGGGHCGYEGNDVDAFDVALNTWHNASNSEHPERLWNHGVRLAGVTFQGGSWTDHGRRIYAYDPVQQKTIMVRPIRLTTGYEPEWLKAFPGKPRAARDALVFPPSSYVKYATWAYAPDSAAWELVGPAPAGLDTLLSTPLGVMGVTVDWPARLNDAGYLLPWNPAQPSTDTAIHLFRGSAWERLDKGQPSPQNLYEMTSLAFDSTRSRVILHGGGIKRDELWTFDMKTARWKNMQPRVLAPEGASPPACMREAVYIPREDVFLTLGDALWAYKANDNGWERTNIPTPAGASGQNRAMVYDPQRDLVLLVLGDDGDTGTASVFALRFRSQTRAVQ